MTTTRSLSPLTRHGACRIATLDECRVGAWATPYGFGGHGTKRPLAVLVATAEGISVRDMSGRALAPEALDALHPGTWAAFHAATRADPFTKQPQEETDP